jgi:cytochrome P450
MPDVTPTTETPPDQPAPGSPVRYEVINTVASGPGEHFARYDALRATAPAHPGIAPAGNPFLLVSSASGIRGCLQDTATFSSSSVTPEEPNPPYKWIPEMLDPPLHTKWRHLLGPFFAPGAVERLKPRVHEVITEILDEVTERGDCDYVADVALRFPNTIFMEIMGLPVADASQFQVWETAILHAGPASAERAFQAMMEVMGYFTELITQRRAHPRQDILSTALTWNIDGEPVSDQDLLSFCLLMFMAGLDTVAMQCPTRCTISRSTRRTASASRPTRDCGRRRSRNSSASTPSWPPGGRPPGIPRSPAARSARARWCGCRSRRPTATPPSSPTPTR